MSKILQNFYKATITLDWTIGTGNFYVSVKPTPTSGWLVISPNNAASREIVTYTNTGTDVNGDYVTVSARGVGGTTEQTHTIGESIRMNVTAEYWADMQNDIDNIVAAGVSDATTTSMGGVELATSAELIAGTDVSGAGHPLVAQPSIINTRILTLSNSVTPIVRTYLNAGSPATWTKPAGLKYVVVEVQAGGGGGGASDSTNSRAGAGGGGGGFSKKTIAVASLGATETVTTGAGGAGGVTVAGTGTTGSSSSFGTHATATGGGGGTAGGTGVGGVGGVGSSGDINTTGGAGVMGNNATDSSGAGGSSMLGGGGKGVSGTTAGNTGGVYGGGGSGGSRSSGSNSAGGDGAAGIVIVTEFY